MASVTGKRSPKRRRTIGDKLRVGALVCAFLLAIKIVEYVAGVKIRHGSLPLLAVLAVVGAWPIIRYFMHVQQLAHPEDEE